MKISPHPKEDLRLEGDNDEAVVLLHGWTGHPLHWHPIAQILNDHGYTVTAPLLAGHGGTVDEFDESSGEEWIASAETAITAVSDRRRVHLAGLSMGGSIAIILAGMTAAHSITTINTPLIMRNPRIYGSPVLAMFRERVYFEPTEPPDPELGVIWEGYESVSVDTINELLRVTFRAYRVARRLRRPSLVIQSRTDATVHPRSGPLLASALGGGLVWLDDSDHNALIDRERFSIADLILDHIEESSSRIRENQSI